MKKTIFPLLMIVLLSFYLGEWIVNIEPKAIAYESTFIPSKEMEFIVVYNWNKERINQEIDEVALKYKVSTTVMKKIIACESQYKIDAVGDSGHSRGLVQIHAKYHPQISTEEANNPKFAIDFLAQNLKEGRGYLWSCYNIHYKS